MESSRAATKTFSTAGQRGGTRIKTCYH